MNTVYTHWSSLQKPLSDDVIPSNYTWTDINNNQHAIVTIKNNNTLLTYFTENNSMHGPYIMYNDTATVLHGYYHYGVAYGLWYLYRTAIDSLLEFQEKWSTVFCLDGETTGANTIYFHMSDNTINGLVTLYTPDTTVTETGSFINGLMNGKHSLTGFYRSVSTYTYGLKHGLLRSWIQSYPQRLGLYQFGIRVGDHITWNNHNIQVDRYSSTGAYTGQDVYNSANRLRCRFLYANNKCYWSAFFDARTVVHIDNRVDVQIWVDDYAINIVINVLPVCNNEHLFNEDCKKVDLLPLTTAGILEQWTTLYQIP